MPELRVDNICYRYKNSDREVLSNISCEFQGGQLYSVVGPSGSGKTTFLSIVAGLDIPSSGAVFIDGENYDDLDLDRFRRERLAMIFQAFHLFPLLTVTENVSYTMEQNGVPKAEVATRARENLTMVDISAQKQKRFPSNLSGGEQQRVAIARALSSGARVILADEPTGNLDVENSNRIIDILRKLAHEEGYCVIIVTHDLAIAEASDKVFHMSDGVLS